MGSETILDQNRCIGCVVCTTKCKFDAIHHVKSFNAPELLLENLEQINTGVRKLRIEKIAVSLGTESKREVANRQCTKKLWVCRGTDTSAYPKLEKN